MAAPPTCGVRLIPPVESYVSYLSLTPPAAVVVESLSLSCPHSCLFNLGAAIASGIRCKDGPSGQGHVPGPRSYSSWTGSSFNPYTRQAAVLGS